MCEWLDPDVAILLSCLSRFIRRCLLTTSVKTSFETAVCPSVCTDCRPPVAGSRLPRGGRGWRFQCPPNSRHALHSLPLLLFQLPLCPEPVATAAQAGVCGSDESQSRGITDEGAYCLFKLQLEPPNTICQIISMVSCSSKEIPLFSVFYTQTRTLLPSNVRLSI